MIIDTHAHICDTKFDKDRNEVIERSLSHGIFKIVEISCEPHYWEKALKLSERNEIWTAFGIHPNNAKSINWQDCKKLEVFINNAKCVAVGECGLDYHYDNSNENKIIQKQLFAKQLELSFQYKKPLIIHCRDAHEDMINILKNTRTGYKGVVHCFSGTLHEAEEYIKLGFYLGIDGPITYKNADALKQTIKEVNIENMLIETDCPYLSPQEHRGERNEPSYLLETLRELSTLKNIPFETAAQLTSKNAIDLFWQPVAHNTP
ncbi:MAG: TatD family hydrolase [Elusimicrobiota bacterium]|jgi:TatD DNase family protein|nr:TatD family hydrolase [Elusimicrobiota bacterium]